MDRETSLKIIARASFMTEVWYPKLSKKECVDKTLIDFRENRAIIKEKANDIVIGEEEYNIIYKNMEELSDEVKKDIIKSVEESKAEVAALKKDMRASFRTRRYCKRR